MTAIKVPTLGESVTEATVAQWLKKEGDEVQADEPIVELETDKVTLEVNAPESGVIAKITVAEGENVEVDTVLGEIEAGASGSKSAANTSSKTEKSDKETTDKTPEGLKGGANDKGDAKNDTEEGDTNEALSPAVRKIVNDNKLDASKIKGTGKDGRITKGDVLAHMEDGGNKEDIAKTPAHKAVSTHQVSNSADQGPREERVRMTRLRQRIAERLKEAQSTAAILTTFNEVDMSAIMDVRKSYKELFEKKHGVKMGFMAFFVKAAVNALKEFPSVNAEIDGDEIVYKNFYDVGVAVSTPQGLLVPVIRDCDTKSMAQIEKDIMDLAGKARDGKIAMEDMQGGTFTVTNGGVFGSLMSTPILNRPQSAILGMHKIQQRPMVMPDGSIEARPMMYLAMSYDHRIIDGRESVSFLVRIKEALEDPQRLLLDL